MLGARSLNPRLGCLFLLLIWSVKSVRVVLQDFWSSCVVLSNAKRWLFALQWLFGAEAIDASGLAGTFGEVLSVLQGGGVRFCGGTVARRISLVGFFFQFLFGFF